MLPHPEPPHNPHESGQQARSSPGGNLVCPLSVPLLHQFWRHTFPWLAPVVNTCTSSRRPVSSAQKRAAISSTFVLAQNCVKPESWSASYAISFCSSMRSPSVEVRAEQLTSAAHALAVVPSSNTTRASPFHTRTALTRWPAVASNWTAVSLTWATFTIVTDALTF
eukprot:scaffold99529_cov63-Phaeocystis_antarctica.AAC.2